MKINDNVEANASSKPEAEKRREEKKKEKEKEPPPPLLTVVARDDADPPEPGGGGGFSDPPDLDFRGRILHAIGLDPLTGQDEGRTRTLGGQTDMGTADRWTFDLGLTEDEVIGAIDEVMQGATGGPVRNFNYFTPAMQRFAAAKANPALQPVAAGTAAQIRKPPDKAKTMATIQEMMNSPIPSVQEAGRGMARNAGIELSEIQART